MERPDPARPRVLGEDRQYVRDRHGPALSRDGSRVTCLCGYAPRASDLPDAVATHVDWELRVRIARRSQVAELASGAPVLSASAVAAPGVPTCLVAGPARGPVAGVRVQLGCPDEGLLRVYDLRVAFWDEAASPVDLGGSALARVPGYADLARRASASESAVGDGAPRRPSRDSVFLPGGALRDARVDLGRVAGPGAGVSVLVLWRGESPGEVSLDVQTSGPAPGR